MDLYNDSHEKVCILSGIKETCITSTLKTGDKEITFEFRKTNRYAADIKEEGYIRTDTDEFVIKQVEPSGEWYKCTGTLNVEELEGKQYPQGFETVEKTVDECLTEAIDGTGWKVILNIIIIIKHIQSLLNICNVLLICQFDICLRNHCNFC